jgi:uroporphyrin-III C-methyltransferase
MCNRLICQDILRLIPSSTKVHIARKLPGRQHPAQEELNNWALEALAQRKRVVRLKIGDPNIFGRGGEEVTLPRLAFYLHRDALSLSNTHTHTMYLYFDLMQASFYRSCGYEPLVVPGISSAMAAPTAAGIPLTLRGVADQVVFATGQGKDYTVPDIPR